MRTGFLFRVWPYVSGCVFLAGLALRHAWSCYRTARQQDGAAGLDLAPAGEWLPGSRWWRAGLLLLFAGHLGGLLFPREILLWNAVPARLYLLEGMAFAAGLTALAGWAGVMWRYLGRSRESAAGQLADSAFLSLCFVAFLSGLLTAVLYRWASSWGALTLSPYVSSLFRGAPAPALAAGMPFLVQLHVFSAFTALAMVPFTRVAPLLTVPLHRGVVMALKPASVTAQWLRQTLQMAMQKYGSGLRAEPEEE